MSRMRDIKRQARRDLHQEMSIPALYIPVPNATPLPCNVRVQRKRDNPTMGEQPAGQMVVTEDRLRFYVHDLPAVLRQNAIVSVEPGEAYRIDFFYPVDDEYQTARVTILTEAEATGLPVPLVI